MPFHGFDDVGADAQNQRLAAKNAEKHLEQLQIQHVVVNDHHEW
jgi:hypothetical protein